MSVYLAIIYLQIWVYTAKYESCYLATIDIPQVLINHASLNIAKHPVRQFWKRLSLISLVRQIMYLFSEQLWQHYCKCVIKDWCRVMHFTV